MTELDVVSTQVHASRGKQNQYFIAFGSKLKMTQNWEVQ